MWADVPDAYGSTHKYDKLRAFLSCCFLSASSPGLLSNSTYTLNTMAFPGHLKLTFAPLLTSLWFLHASAACYFRSSSSVIRADEWNTCNNNSEIVAGGANLCCNYARDSVCGDGGLCRQDDGLFYVGGCTDSTYQDPVCRTSCSEYQSASSFEW